MNLFESIPNLIECYKQGDKLVGRELFNYMKPLVDKAVRMVEPVGDIHEVDMKLMAQIELRRIFHDYTSKNGNLSDYAVTRLVQFFEKEMYKIDSVEVLRQAERKAQILYEDEVTAYHINHFLPDHLPIKNNLQEIELLRGYRNHLTCSTCNGEKWKECPSCSGSGNGPFGGQCVNCKGNGEFECPECKGEGYV